MKIWDLFEQQTQSPPLTSGEVRSQPDIQIKNFQAIHRKIDDLLKNLESSQTLQRQFAKDVVLQQALDKLTKRLELKITYLSRMRDRPSSGERRVREILTTECSDFVQLVQRTRRLIYMGTDNMGSVFEGKSQEKNQSAPSTGNVNYSIDVALKNKGFKALINNSIVTNSDSYVASRKGDALYVIFPKNGSNLLTTNDLSLGLAAYPQLVDETMLAEFSDKLYNWIKSQAPNNTNALLVNAAVSRNYRSMFRELREIFHASEENTLELPEEFNVGWEDFVTDDSIIKNLDPSLDISDSMRAGREILVNGEYWAFHRNDWENFLSDKFIY